MMSYLEKGLSKQHFYAELRQSQDNMYSGELGLLQYSGNALMSLVEKQNVSVGRSSRVLPGG